MSDRGIVDTSAVVQSYRGKSGAPKFASSSEALLAYAGAFAEKDLDFIRGAISEETLLELPMVKPCRLLGVSEIVSAHTEAFKTISNATFELHSPIEKGSLAIAEGALKVSRAGKEETHPLGIVAETNNGKLKRVTLYFDARHHRLWSDKTIL